MTSLWFGSISSLVGVLVGAGATYLIQSLNWRRETRRQVYADFVGESRIWLDSIGRVSFAIEHGFSNADLVPHWDRANAGRARVFGLRAQIDMLAEKATQITALELERSIEDINKKIYNYGDDLAHPPDAKTYREEFDCRLEKFRHAASADLYLSRLGRWSGLLLGLTRIRSRRDRFQ